MKGFHETNFRGLGFSQFTQKNPVVIFIDGIAQDNYANYGADILNVERIEVLRGSQGTLYGKNAIGGVINIISKKPDNNFDSQVTTELAEHNTYSVKSFVNGPIIKDTLFFGISGIYSQTDGYMENDCPDSDNFDYEKSIGLNSRLRWIPSDRMEINLHAGMVQNQDGAGRSINAETSGVKYQKQMDYRYEVTSIDTGSLLSRVTYNIEDDWDVLLPKAALSWSVNKDTMIYTSVAKGYLAGGFNLCENVKEQAKFDEQSSIDYELGVKTSWFNNKLIFNANIFYMDIKDMHVYSAPDGITYITSNAAEAHSRGVEIEAKARPFKGLDLIAALGLAQAEYDEYTNTDGVNCQGHDLPVSPDYTLNLAVQYRHDSGFFCRAGMQGYGQNYFNEANTVSQKAYQIYNAKIGYEGSNWDVYVYGKNLLDEEYFSSGRVNAMGINANVGEPQTFGIIVSIRF